jgi:hypothetical protein
MAVLCSLEPCYACERPSVRQAADKWLYPADDAHSREGANALHIMPVPCFANATLASILAVVPCRRHVHVLASLRRARPARRPSAAR